MPSDPERSPPTWKALSADLLRNGVIDEDGAPGPRADDLVEGGFARVRLDLPGRRTLYANGQGGFRVRCPAGGVVTAAWSRAASAWREGGPAVLACPACGADHAFEALDYAPPAAYGPFAVVIADAATSAVARLGGDLLRGHLGPFSVIGRRVG